MLTATRAAYPMPMSAPPPIASHDHSRAFFEAFSAPTMSPAANYEFTCEAKMMPTAPRGTQQNKVARIAMTRWFLIGAG